MSDKCLRDRERRWKTTGTVENEVTYLLERFRSGELDEERLELAACLGHVPSRQVLECKKLELDWGGKRFALKLKNLFREIEVRGDCLLFVRAIVVVLWKILPNYKGQYEITGMLEEIDDWILDPSCGFSETTLSQINEGMFSSDPRDFIDGDRFYSGDELVPVVFNCAVGLLVSEIAGTPRIDEIGMIVPMVKAAACSVDDFHDDTFAQEFIQRLVSQELAPWILRTGDPVRERVEARREVCIEEGVRDEVKETLD